MQNRRFSSLMFLIVPQIIEIILKDKDNDAAEETATELFYKSELYAQLEDEQTKLWHLSPLALFEMYREEQTTGKITYPEEA